MRIGILLPGFSAYADDWAIPVQQNLARELAVRDDLRIIALRYPHHRRTYRLDGAVVYPLGVGQVRGVGRIALWQRTLCLIERLHREKPFDVLHAMWADETGLIAGWAGKHLDLPVVVSILGGELVGLRDIDYGLQLSRFSRWIVGQAISSADRVIVPSRYVRDLLQRSDYCVPELKIALITLGVDIERFKPVAAEPDPYRLIYVASLVPVKDQVTLLRTLALLDHKVTLDIVGVGSERARLEALTRHLALKNQVRFLGAAAHPDLPGYYQQATVNVLSSRHETIAMTTLEAAACGLPTVSTAVGIAPDYPALGITVPVGDAEALAQAIQLLLDAPEKRTHFRRLFSRPLVRREISIQVTAERLRAVYADLVAKQGFTEF